MLVGECRFKGQLISDQPILARDANQKIFGEPMGPVQIRLTHASRDRRGRITRYLLTQA